MHTSHSSSSAHSLAFSLLLCVAAALGTMWDKYGSGDEVEDDGEEGQVRDGEGANVDMADIPRI